MLLDLIYLILVVLALIKGFQRGLIVGIFSFVAIIAGLAAAIKLSAVVAGYLSEKGNISDRWLPILSFVIVFVGIVFLVNIGARLIQKAIEFSMLGWVNKLGGILLYIAIYTTVFSIFLFYADQLKFISDTTKQQSIAYSFLQPWGPKIIDGLGTIIPFFKDMFAELEIFFEQIAQKVS